MDVKIIHRIFHLEIMYTTLKTVKSESGIEIIDPKELLNAKANHDNDRIRSMVVALLATANNAIATRVDELNKTRGTREIGAVVTVTIDAMYNTSTIDEVKRQLIDIGYAVKFCDDPGYDDRMTYSGPSRWFEIYV